MKLVLIDFSIFDAELVYSTLNCQALVVWWIHGVGVVDMCFPILLGADRCTNTLQMFVLTELGHGGSWWGLPPLCHNSRLR